MFWLRIKKNNFPESTLIWRPIIKVHLGFFCTFIYTDKVVQINDTSDETHSNRVFNCRNSEMLKVVQREYNAPHRITGIFVNKKVVI